MSFGGAGVEGGFELDPAGRAPTSDGALVLVFSTDLEATEHAVLDHGGTIVRPADELTGGRRFHVHDPSGNELAVWTPA